MNMAEKVAERVLVRYLQAAVRCRAAKRVHAEGDHRGTQAVSPHR